MLQITSSLPFLRFLLSSCKDKISSEINQHNAAVNIVTRVLVVLHQHSLFLPMGQSEGSHVK